MNRAPLLCGLVLWVGASLLISRSRWGNQTGLVGRLRPHIGSKGNRGAAQPAGVLSAQSFREVLAPLAQGVGDRIAKLIGVADGLAIRLRRIGSAEDPTSFRVRQVGHSALATGVMLGVLVAVRAPLLIASLALLGAPALTFLVIEQRLISASKRRQARLFEELPIVAEQIGTLLGAGYSLGAALNRIARRSNGVCAEDLRTVTNRVRQGLAEATALAEWAQLADVPELSRFLNVLNLNSEAGDVSRLIGDEARSMRREAQRRALVVVERRNQLVWIPVTVATLIPGVLLMGIPFISALDAWAAF